MRANEVRVGNPMLNASRQVWLAGLGAAVVTRDWAQNEAGDVFRSLVKEGTAVESKTIRMVGDRLGLGFLGLGMWPDKTRAELPVMPKGRYEIMLRHMPRVGSMGLDMMLRTCTVQVNLDFGDEADMVEKLRVSDPYEAPEHPEVRVNSEHQDEAQSLEAILNYLEQCGLVPAASRV